VREVVIHPREQDLIVGTHGRAAFVLDDIRPLRSLDEKVLAEPLHFFEIADAQQYRVRQTGESRFPGATEFRGQNRPYGAILDFVVNGEGLPHPEEKVQKEEQAAERAREAQEPESSDESNEDSQTEAAPEDSNSVEIEILDAEGTVLRKFERDVTRGFNRVTWNLHTDGFRRPPDAEGEFADDPQGPQVVPGDYTVKLHFRDEVASQPVRVLADPRTDLTLGDRRANYETRRRAGALEEMVADAITRIVNAREDVDTLLGRIDRERQDQKQHGVEWEDDAKPYGELEKSAREFRKKLDELEKGLRVPPGTKGIPADETPLARIQRVQWFLGSSWEAPSPELLEHLRDAESAVRAAVDSTHVFFADELPVFRSKVLENKDLEILADTPFPSDD
jgi:hypothetical protein